MGVQQSYVTDKGIHMVALSKEADDPAFHDDSQATSVERFEDSTPDCNDGVLESYILEDCNVVFVDVLLNRRNIAEKDEFITFPIVLASSVKEYALLDSAASASLLSTQFVQSWSEPAKLSDEPNVMLRSFAGNKFSAKSTVVAVQTSNNHEPFMHKFLVVDMQWPIICGKDLIHLCKISINNVPIDFPKESQVKQNCDSIPSEPTKQHAEEVETSDKVFLEKFALQQYIDANWSTARLPYNHPDSVIHLDVDETKMKYVRQYLIPEIYRPFVEKQIAEWLQLGVIEIASAANKWNNPILTVPKYLPSGEIDTSSRRVCMDARFINEALISDDKFPVPIIIDIYGDMADAGLFTEMDCVQAYTQFEVDVESRKYLGICWGGNHYQFTRAIYGLKFMSSRFQRVMPIILQGFSHTRGYIDNVLTFSIAGDLVQHAAFVIETLKRLTQYNITINPNKCKWARHKLKVLGHEISSVGIGIDPFKVHVVDNLQVPKTGPQLESHLGLFNYFRRFIPLYSKWAAPLEAIRKHSVLTWTQREQSSWDALRTAIKNAPILCPPNLSKEFLIATDASDYGLGVILFQKKNNDDIRYIEFASRALSPSEKNYSATKLELAAVVFALDKFEGHLLRPFTLYTDHSALVSLFKSKLTFQVLTNEWYEKVLRFIDTMKIVHCPGADNVLPDLLSRTFKKNAVQINGVIVSELQMQETKGNSHMDVEESTQIPAKIDVPIKLADSLLLKTVVKDQKKKELLNSAHSMGHFGARSVKLLIIKEGYYWPNMNVDIAKFIENCQACQTFKVTREGFHPMRSLDAEYPFEMIAMDLCGPLPNTQHRNRYVLVVVDVATRFCLLRAIPDKFATTVAGQLVLNMAEFGIVKIILSDNGTEFFNSLLAEIKKAWKIDKRTITPYYPQGNGISESKVKNVKTVLQRLSEAAKRNAEKVAEWDQILPMVEMIMNIKPNDTTKTSPFELFYGRPFPGFLDFRTYQPVSMTESEIISRWKKLYEIIFPAVRKLTKSSQESAARAFELERKVETVMLKPGTVVMFEIDGLRGAMKKKTFQPAYQGPAIVERVNLAGNYVLRRWILEASFVLVLLPN